MSAQMLEVSQLGVGTVLRLERDAWSMVKLLRQATNEYAPPPSPPSPISPSPSPSIMDTLDTVDTTAPPYPGAFSNYFPVL